MSKVLIFTNAGSVAQTAFYHRFESAYPIAEEPFSLFSFEGNDARLCTVKDCAKEGVYLVFDGADDPNYNHTFDTILNQCEGSEVYALVHSLPTRKGDFVKSGFAKPTVGRHEPGDRNHYYPIFEILSDEKGEKEMRILRRLKPLDSRVLLNSALKFFDACMTPDKVSEAMVTGEQLMNDEEFGEDIRGFFYNSYTKDGVPQEYENYFQSLIMVSDKVLSIIIKRVDKEKAADKIVENDCCG